MHGIRLRFQKCYIAEKRLRVIQQINSWPYENPPQHGKNVSRALSDAGRAATRSRWIPGATSNRVRRALAVGRSRQSTLGDSPPRPGRGSIKHASRRSLRKTRRDRLRAFATIGSAFAARPGTRRERPSA
jgi:hypothetical protein